MRHSPRTAGAGPGYRVGQIRARKAFPPAEIAAYTRHRRQVPHIVHRAKPARQGSAPEYAVCHMLHNPETWLCPFRAHSKLAPRLEKLPIWQPYCRQPPGAIRSRIDTNLVGLQQRLWQLLVPKHHRLAPIIVTVKEAFDAPHLVQPCRAPDWLAWRHARVNIIGIGIFIFDARFLQPVARLEYEDTYAYYRYLHIRCAFPPASSPPRTESAHRSRPTPPSPRR